MRLIDADALRDKLQEEIDKAIPPFDDVIGSIRCGVRLARNIVEDEPTIDAVTVADIIEVEKERNYWHDLADSYERTILKLNNALQESVPVRHGHWVGIDDEQCEVWECDVCGYIYETDSKLHRYCPNCGARMDTDEKI